MSKKLPIDHKRRISTSTIVFLVCAILCLIIGLVILLSQILSEFSTAFAVIFFIGAVVLLVLFIRGIYNDFRYKVNFDASEYAEYEVNKWLQKLCKYNKDFYFLNSIIIPNKKTKTTEIDHILFTPFVVLVLETKHWSGTIKGCESDEYWIQELGHNIIHKKINAYKQNQAHINSLKELLHTNIDGCIIFDRSADIEWLDVKNILYKNKVNEWFDSNYHDAKAIYNSAKVKSMYEKIKKFKDNPICSRQEHIQNLNRTYKDKVGLML